MDPPLHECEDSNHHASGSGAPAEETASADRPSTPGCPDVSIEGYEIIRELHRGGQGIVCEALQRSTKRKVAIKLLMGGRYAPSTAKKRFEREIELIAQLKHPNIIWIFHSGLTDDGVQFYVMDYVRGLPLHQYVREKKLTLEETLKLFATVCEAVQYAHRRGVIHRDLKPSNVLVDGEGKPRVLDFGLAKLLAGPVDTVVSVTQDVIGTLPYMSPEQARGASDEIDARTDIYSLGVILYELLTGHFPYPVTGQMSDVIKHITDTPPTPPTRRWTRGSGVTRRSARRLRGGACPIDEEVQIIVLKTLAKERERRYQNAEDLACDILRYLSGEPIEARRASGWYRMRKSLSRHRMFAAIVTLSLLTVVSWGLLSITRGRVEAHRARERAFVLENCREAMMLMDDTRLDAWLDRADELEVDPALRHCYRAIAHTVRLDVPPAMAEVNKALELNPQLPDAYYVRAGLHYYRARAGLDISSLAKIARDFALARQYATDSELNTACDAFVQVMMRRYESGLQLLDELCARQHGAGRTLWIRGFCKWLRLSTDPVLNIETRLHWAQDAMADIKAAATLYPLVPFVHDVRADLCRRLAWLHAARGDTDKFNDSLRDLRRVAEELLARGARGAGYRWLGRMSIITGDAETATTYADQAYHHLTEPAAARGFHKEDALLSAISQRVWLSFVRGDAAATARLAQQLRSRHPVAARFFVFGFVRVETANRAVLLAEDTNLGNPWANGIPANFGLWAGAVARGDHELADHVAGRFSIGTLNPLDTAWHRALSHCLRTRTDGAKLIQAAGSDPGRVRLARFISALLEPSRESRITGLRAVISLALPNKEMDWVQCILLRCERDPSYLDFENLPSADTGSLSNP